MQKIKLAIIIIIFTVFALFTGMQASDAGTGIFNKAFYTTLIFGLGYFILITIYYIAAKTSFVRKGAADKYANPLDIWLLSIPMCILMIIAYIVLNWHVTEVFFCTTISLSGMFFAVSRPDFAITASPGNSYNFV